MVIIVLSAADWSVGEIAEVLHYDLDTVHREMIGHQQQGLAELPDRPRSNRPHEGSPPLG
jgi:hypothetical protein